MWRGWFRTRVALALSVIMLGLAMRAFAQTSQYTISQITSGPTDHDWPAINNNGDIVWSQQVNGLWQVFKQSGTGGSPAPIVVPDPAHNFEYPDISDSGSILYLKDSVGQGAGLEVILNQQGVENIVEISSSNVGASRTAGQHFGISRNGTTVSYYDFCSGGCVRRFDASTVGTLQCGGASCDFGTADYPDIDNKGDVVYFDPTTGYISKFTVPNVSPVAIVPGSFARINNSGDLAVVSAGQISVYLGPSYVNSKFVNAGTWAGINDLGIVVFQTADSAGHQQIYKAVPNNSVTLLDPVPDLLCGLPSVIGPSGQCGTVNGFDQLATGGRVVQGVAADGVAEVVIRISAVNAGDQYTLTLLNDQGIQSSNADEDGALGTPGLQAFTQSVITVSAIATTSHGAIAFAVYRAPVDFPRPLGQDTNSVTRMVSMTVQNLANGSSSTVPITILRPPVVLVHGLWADASTWDNFTSLANDPQGRFNVSRIDYSAPIFGLSSYSYSPSYPSAVAALIYLNANENSEGFVTNALTVMSKSQYYVAQFKNFNLPGIPVAAIQADIVAHSMGGDIAREMPLLADFYSVDTFGQGNIHKVVTIGTPHLGSPLAGQLLSSSNSCVRDLFAMFNLVSFDSVTINGIQDTGAVADLQGDGSGGALSGPLQAIKAGGAGIRQIPVAMIAGQMNATNLSGLNTCVLCLASVIRAHCGGSPLADMLTPIGWPTFFVNQSVNPGGWSDGFVSPYSALDGTAGSPVNGVIHSSGTGYLGFLPPTELDDSTGIPKAVVGLLNTWINNPAFTQLP